MKKFILPTVLFVAVLIASCGGGDHDHHAQEGPSACDCAKAIMAKSSDADMLAKCKEARTDADFEKEYKKCMAGEMTGQDTSKVNFKDPSDMEMNMPADGTYAINTAESEIKWTGKKFAGQHMGLVPVQAGTATVENGMITSGELTLAIAELSVTDLEGKEKSDLEGHLLSPDFFNAAEHPTATFKIESTEKADDNKLKASGTLTIKGTEKPLECSMMFSANGDNGMILTGAAVFDRTDYDIRYGSDKFFDNLGDKVIKDMVTLSFKLKADKEMAEATEAEMES